MNIDQEKIRVYNEKIKELRELSDQIYHAERQLMDFRDRQKSISADLNRLVETICADLGLEEL